MKAITAGEFIKALEDIEYEIDDNLVLSVKYKNKLIPIMLGQYGDGENPIPDSSANERMKSNQVADLNIIPNYPKTGQVYFYCENPKLVDLLEWLFTYTDDFEWGFNRCRVRDDDIIIGNVPFEDSDGNIDYYTFIITNITNDGQEVILHTEPYNGQNLVKSREPDIYEVTYTVWEQNKYSVEIEASSEEEAEAIFEEDNNNSTYPDKKDFEVVSVEKT